MINISTEVYNYNLDGNYHTVHIYIKIKYLNDLAQFYRTNCPAIKHLTEVF